MDSLGSLRKPLFFAAIALLGLILLTEVSIAVAALLIEAPSGAVGWGIPVLALLDIQLVFTAMLMAAPLMFPESVTGRIQGIATFVVALIVVIIAMIVGFAALGLLMVLVALLTALPFGPGVYAAMGYASFPVGAAAATLAFIVTCKLVCIGALALAHQRFLENKGLMLLMGTTLLATIIVSVLHGIVPVFLASVTDLIGAIIIVILAVVWAMLGLIYGAIAVFKALA
jgi:hypothetical protein